MAQRSPLIQLSRTKLHKYARFFKILFDLDPWIILWETSENIKKMPDLTMFE